MRPPTLKEGLAWTDVGEGGGSFSGCSVVTERMDMAVERPNRRGERGRRQRRAQPRPCLTCWVYIESGLRLDVQKIVSRGDKPRGKRVEEISAGATPNMFPILDQRRSVPVTSLRPGCRPRVDAASLAELIGVIILCLPLVHSG